MFCTVVVVHRIVVARSLLVSRLCLFVLLCLVVSILMKLGRDHRMLHARVWSSMECGWRARWFSVEVEVNLVLSQ